MGNRGADGDLGIPVARHKWYSVHFPPTQLAPQAKGREFFSEYSVLATSSPHRNSRFKVIISGWRQRVLSFGSTCSFLMHYSPPLFPHMMHHRNFTSTSKRATMDLACETPDFPIPRPPTPREGPSLHVTGTSQSGVGSRRPKYYISTRTENRMGTRTRREDLQSLG